PDYAVITNIGESHIEYLGSREGIAQAKLEIKAGLKIDGKLLIDGDEPLLQSEMQQRNTIGIGFSNEHDIVLANTFLTERTTKIDYEASSFQVPSLCKHHAKNSAFAICLAHTLHITSEQVNTVL